MNIFGIGTDIVSVNRIKNSIKNKNFINRIFNEKEILKCKKINTAVNKGNKLGLEIHAGHGLTYTSAKILSKIKGIKEFNIGHFLVGEAIFTGMSYTIKRFKKILRSW